MRRLATVAIVAALLGGLVAAGSAPASALPAEPDDSTCVRGGWPGEFEGRPASFGPHAARGLYVWHDARGWHLGVTHEGEGPVVFKGSISVNGRLLGVERFTEGRDDARITFDHRRIGFRFVNRGWTDGVDFVTRCTSRIVIRGTIDGAPITAAQVFVGAAATHPAGTPLVIERTQEVPSRV